MNQKQINALPEEVKDKFRIEGMKILFDRLDIETKKAWGFPRIPHIDPFKHLKKEYLNPDNWGDKK